MENPSRREFLGAAGTALAAARIRGEGVAERRPNVVLVLTDDQGYGDISCHGNEKIRTPNIDRLAAEGVEVDPFIVSPVCAPTRACLLTGRYNYRMGVVDTYIGRAMMDPRESTIAEILAAAGYRTGIFGKWHLGDNHPMRPHERGFQEALVHTGGGIGQPSDPPGNRYFDPILQHNGKAEKHLGYCTDIFFDAAIRFIEEDRERPFFAYVAPNCPHAPYEVDEALVAPVRGRGLPEPVARSYAMTENIDANLGRLLAALDRLGLARDTIVIFLTDNGPDAERFTAGLRGRKGTPYEGGIRTAFFARWPARIPAGTKVRRMAAHIDVAPTLLAACGVPRPARVAFDGRDILPLLVGRDAPWPGRSIFIQWHRGDVPEAFRGSAVREERWKLVEGRELYDLAADPHEGNDVAADHPEIVARMRAAYETWFEDVSTPRGYDPPRIHVGTPFESPTTLTRQDWRGPRGGWAPDSLGHWEILVARAGAYAITLRFGALGRAGAAHLRVGPVELAQPVERGCGACRFSGVRLPRGEARLEAWLALGEKTIGVEYVDVLRTGE